MVRETVFINVHLAHNIISNGVETTHVHFDYGTIIKMLEKSIKNYRLKIFFLNKNIVNDNDNSFYLIVIYVFLEEKKIYTIQIYTHPSGS